MAPAKQLVITRRVVESTMGKKIERAAEFHCRRDVRPFGRHEQVTYNKREGGNVRSYSTAYVVHGRRISQAGGKNHLIANRILLICIGRYKTF